MKDLNDLWDEYDETDSLSLESKKALIWHLENDSDPQKAISMTTDMGLKELAPYLAKHLKHEDDFIGEFTIGCLLGRLKLPQYAEIGLKLATEDPEINVRGLALSNIGEVLNVIQDKALKHKIASLLYKVVMENKEDELIRAFAYSSILASLEFSILERPLLRDGETLEIDYDVIETFKKKFNINLPT